MHTEVGLHVSVAISFALPAYSVFAFNVADFLTGTNVGPMNVIRRASTTDIITGLSVIHHTSRHMDSTHIATSQ